MERGPLSLVNTTEELLGRKSSGSGLENREYGRGDPLRWPRDNIYPQKLALTSPTKGGNSVDIVLLRTNAKELVLFEWLIITSISVFQANIWLNIYSKIWNISPETSYYFLKPFDVPYY
jgi:hypothetical protein